MFTICLPGDVDEAAAVLSDAFTGDPLFEFIFPDPDRHPGQVGRFAAITARRGIANGHGYKYVDDDRILGVAMWSPPGRRFYTSDDGDRIGDTIVAADPNRAGMLYGGLTEMGSHQPETPHFHLAMIGVRTSARGRGIGSRLLAGSLAIVDRVGADANLESSNPRNVSLYQRHGFEIRAEVAMPEGGPIVRPMFRPAPDRV